VKQESEQTMSEELNPTGEENTTPADTPVVETTPVEQPAAETPAEAPSAAPATEAPPVAPAPEPVTTPPPAPAPSAPPPSTSAPAGTPLTATASGPSEFVPEAGGGGRSRRTNIDARLEEIHFKNVALLSRFIDPRGRILSRRKTRVSAKMQRKVVKSIKLARHLALLPYTADQTRIVRKRR
jgi:small subunit ribosomal protein S18